ncbi:MAG TPA: hypothetical protein VNO55_01195, partial [Polyangia bacterium]|nr:hypothetical protein [Polyangia bacterium]
TGATVTLDDDAVLDATPGLDAAHASAGPCYGCHRTLDPTRSILSSTWSWNYHSQLDPTWTAQPGLFAFRGMVRPVASVGDLGDALARHPLVAAGWVQKLCHYVNSVACDENDPEFQRLVQQFRDSNFQWPVLVKALVTSPLTTHAAATTTAEKNGGEVIAVARRDHLCAALNARLGLADVCGLNPRAGSSSTGATTTIAQIVSGLPSDAYGRGAVAPILPSEPNLLFLAGVRNICETVAAFVVDPGDGPAAAPAARRWSSAAPDTAIADLVATLMALGPSDPRAAGATTLLKEHFTAALAQPGATPTDALRSTFAVACQAPSLISVGL